MNKKFLKYVLWMHIFVKLLKKYKARFSKIDKSIFYFPGLNELKSILTDIFLNLFAEIIS
jgi:hypothetical protein